MVAWTKACGYQRTPSWSSFPGTCTSKEFRKLFHELHIPAHGGNVKKHMSLNLNDDYADVYQELRKKYLLWREKTPDPRKSRYISMPLVMSWKCNSRSVRFSIPVMDPQEGTWRDFLLMIPQRFVSAAEIHRQRWSVVGGRLDHMVLYGRHGQ